MFGDMFGAYRWLFLVVFISIVGIFIGSLVMIIRTYFKNLNSPKLTVPAMAVSKRKVQNMTSDRDRYSHYINF